MITVQGVVRKLGVEGGVWALLADDGRQFHLLDAPGAIKRDGLRVSVTGDEQRGASLAMVGSMLRVRSFEVR
jgi:hypothetical protein